jgi:hypothetical protein
MGVTATTDISDPSRLTGRSRQSAIERHPALCDDKRAPTDNPPVKSLVNLCAVIGQNALSYSDAGISQLNDALAGVARIYISCAYNYVSDSSFEYGSCTRSGASFCGARFQRNVKGGPGGQWRTEIAKAFNLRVIAAGSSMMSPRHNSIADDENRSNCGIRASLTERFLCLVKCRAHELFVSCSIHRFREINSCSR